MQIIDVISELEKAPEGNRFLDSRIAFALGWERTPKELKHDATGEVSTKYIWFDPVSEKQVQVPRFTTSVHDAYELSQRVDPDCNGAVRRSAEGYMSQIGLDGTQAQAATAPIALCIAILHHLKKKGLDAK